MSPKRHITISPDAKITTTFALTFLVLIINAIVSQQNTKGLTASKEYVAHTWEVKYSLQHLYALLGDAERRQRGYLLTGDERYIEPYELALNNINIQLTEIRRLTSDNTDQQQRLTALREKTRLRIETLNTHIDRKKKYKIPVDKSLMERGRIQMQAVESILHDMERREDDLLEMRLAISQKSATTTRQTFFFATFVAAMAVGFSWFLIHCILAERQHANAEMSLVLRDLENRILERTTSLSKANTRLEEANRELEAFSYSVSHDLRSPLRHIGGFVDLLQKKEADRLSETGRRYVTVISESVKHAGVLVDDLLTFSRMGRTAMRSVPVTMDSLVNEVRRDLATETEVRDIEWEIAPLPVVSGDPTLLRLVWQNLIGNAVKYSAPRAPAHIEIGVVEQPEEYHFFVKDDGVGFDMQYSDKLFGVFQRLHSKDQFEGTGIGLANVRRIITRHGGKTWAEGKLDFGATLWFSLPKTGLEGEKEVGTETNTSG